MYHHPQYHLMMLMLGRAKTKEGEDGRVSISMQILQGGCNLPSSLLAGSIIIFVFILYVIIIIMIAIKFEDFYDYIHCYDS